MAKMHFFMPNWMVYTACLGLPSGHMGVGHTSEPAEVTCRRCLEELRLNPMYKYLKEIRNENEGRKTLE